MIGIGLLVSTMLIGEWGGDQALVEYFIGLGFNLAVGICAFWICCHLWIGVDAPFYLNALRLIGIYLVVDAVFFGSGFMVSPILGWFLMPLCYIGLLAQVLDLELGDAIMLAVITLGIKIAVVITLFSVL